MAGKWETEVGQLRLIDGIRQEAPVNLAIVERRAFFPFRGKGKGQLYVLVELSGGQFGREELCRELVSAITEEYFSTPGTVTYGLRQAVLLANTILVRENAKVSSEHRLGGVICVVLRDGEMLIAQAGWPMVYLIHHSQVQAFPDTLLESEDASMLGQNQTTQVRLFHATIQSGDMVLMVDGPMARQLGITRIGQIVAGNVERAMRNIESLAPQEDCTAVVVRIGGTTTPSESQAERWAFMEVEPPEEEPVASDEEVEPVVRPASRTPERIQQPVRVEEEAPFDEEMAPLPSAEVPPEETRSFEARPVRQTLGERATTLLKKVGQGAQALGKSMLPDGQPTTGAGRTQRRRSAARARHKRGPEGVQTRWWIAAAIAIPIIALLFVLGYTWYRDWSRKSQFAAKLEAIKSKRDLALGSAESPLVARDHWQEVITLSSEADVLQPESPEVSQLRIQAESEIDRIDGVIRLGQAYRLYEYTTSGSTPSRIIVAGLDVYVLDRGIGSVYHHALNELRNALRNPSADQVLVQRGQPVEGQNVGSLVDIAWMKDGGERQAGALVILDANGRLLEYDPTWEQFQAQTLGGASEWRRPTTLSTYDSNLYVLDSMANQVFKYPDQQFAGTPTRWLTQQGINIANAISFGIDGNIYLLHKDGRLIKYYGGEETTFTVTRMPMPLSNADALYMDVEEVVKHIYIADSTEARVVQLDREGVFVRQLKPARGQEATFRQLSGLFVDEVGGKLYYAAGNALYVADLPPLQQ